MDYYEYTWNKTKNSKPITEFGIISASLQNDILFEQYCDFIIQCPLFIQLEQIEICKLIRLLDSGVYMPGEYIISKGDVGHEMFFLTTGEVEVHINGKCVDKKSNGDFFGEISFLWDSRRTATIIAQDYCFTKVFRK